MFGRLVDSPIEKNRSPVKNEAPDRRRFEEEEIKRYEPPKKNPPKLAPRVSRLDSLLQEDSDDSYYDIDNILKNIEKK